MSKRRSSRTKKTHDEPLFETLPPQATDTELLEHTMHFERRIFDLEQMLDIAMSFCQNLSFKNLLESIIYSCMAQMHVLGAEIFVRDFIKNDVFTLETADDVKENVTIPADSLIAERLLSGQQPFTLEELKAEIPECTDFAVLERLSPTLVVPLIQKNHLNGILVLQERIVIEGDTTYNDYEKTQIMRIANLASIAINNAALLEKSSTDMMTGLKLKYYFYTVLTEAMDDAFVKDQNIAVLMFDIDFFKKFNDTYGHECGDFVLINVAQLIKKSLRDSDVASRYGGEEFTVLLYETEKDEAMLVAERIRKTVDEHDFVFNDQHLHVTISVGVSVLDKKKNPVRVANEFVNQADKGLYISKQNGRNQVSFCDS